MGEIVFDGQQTDERILATIIPHSVAKQIAFAKVSFLALFLFLVAGMISSAVPAIGTTILVGGFLLSILALGGGIWWTTTTYAAAKTYLTDRRIIRFEAVSPFFVTKRALFWNEALKAKGYIPNLLYKVLRMGHLRVEPHLAEHEDVFVPNVEYYEDLANYIDKILFTFKNRPDEIGSLKPFIPKPRGQRD